MDIRINARAAGQPSEGGCRAAPRQGRTGQTGRLPHGTTNRCNKGLTGPDWDLTGPDGGREGPQGGREVLIGRRCWGQGGHPEVKQSMKAVLRIEF